MKYVSSGVKYTFTPGAAGVGVIDFGGEPGFTPVNLFAIINLSAVTSTANGIIYATGTAGLGATIGGPTGKSLTLQADTSMMNASDLLQIIVDEGNDNLADLLSAAAGVPDPDADYVAPAGVVTRPRFVEDMLVQLLIEQKLTNILLHQMITPMSDTLDDLRSALIPTEA